MSTTIAPPQYPQGDAEWQNAADAAHALLAVDAARAYGLISGGPDVDTGRCAEVLDRAHGMGLAPAEDAIERYVKGIAEEAREGDWFS